MFYDNFVKACNLHNKAPSAVAIDIGISKATVTGWKNGSMPSDATLRKLADYFGISPSDLTSERDLNIGQGEVRIDRRAGTGKSHTLLSITDDVQSDKKTAAQEDSGLREEFGRLFDTLTPEDQTAIIAEMLKRLREH